MNWFAPFDRTKTPSRRRAPALLGLALPLLAAIGGCVPSTMNWTPAESPKAVQVDTVRFAHDVAFEGTGASLTQASRAELAAFLRQNIVTGNDDIYIVAPVEGSGASLAKRRAQSVEAALKSAGIASTLVPISDGPVTVAVIRYVITPPNCPDWSKPADRDHGNTPHSNFGCATAANLGAMVARPRDLVEGRDPGPYDARALVRGVDKYRDGQAPKTPALPSIVISGGAAGGGGK
ncbi:MAG: CpaD family pilus assembly lipoprotein [Alphaproteobacteria bacterium]